MSDGKDVVQLLRDGFFMRFEAADEIESLRAQLAKARGALEQIAIVCTDNMDRDKNHRMALDFVRQVANDAVDSK